VHMRIWPGPFRRPGAYPLSRPRCDGKKACLWGWRVWETGTPARRFDPWVVHVQRRARMTSAVQSLLEKLELAERQPPKKRRPLGKFAHKQLSCVLLISCAGPSVEHSENRRGFMCRSCAAFHVIRPSVERPALSRLKSARSCFTVGRAFLRCLSKGSDSTTKPFKAPGRQALSSRSPGDG
jgi:hypothetical protein